MVGKSTCRIHNDGNKRMFLVVMVLFVTLVSAVGSSQELGKDEKVRPDGVFCGPSFFDKQCVRHREMVGSSQDCRYDPHNCGSSWPYAGERTELWRRWDECQYWQCAQCCLVGFCWKECCCPGAKWIENETTWVEKWFLGCGCDGCPNPPCPIGLEPIGLDGAPRSCGLLRLTAIGRFGFNAYRLRPTFAVIAHTVRVHEER